MRNTLATQGVAVEESETIVRYAPLDPARNSVEIYTSGPQPIDPFWIAVTDVWSSFGDLTYPKQGFVLYFLASDGHILAREQFETLEIALDQAHSIAGVGFDQWRAAGLVLDCASMVLPSFSEVASGNQFIQPPGR